MSKIWEVALVIMAVAAVAVADALTKKAAVDSLSFAGVLKNPLMLAVVCLYALQVFIFAYVFWRKAELGVVGIIQTALYAVIVVGSGVAFFNERISLVQGIGMGLAVLGVVLTSL